MSALDWVPALDHPELLAPGTLAALTAWAAVSPEVATRVLVAAIDPELADTATLTAAFDLDPGASVNCVLVAGRRDGQERLAAAAVRATTRADVNATVKRLLDVRKASFLATDRAVDESGMEYGGITPLGLPAQFRVLVDSRVDDEALVVIGSGLRRSKIGLPGSLLAAAPGVQVVDGLAIG
ncbi:MAG: hypothetical protein KJ792_00025 [Actinobacteria bacterium]|nr:hypothetical protein [Actinomycetota bacterium]MCG2802749.1 hypothetical protein [Cellulomonas sp.]